MPTSIMGGTAMPRLVGREALGLFQVLGDTVGLAEVHNDLGLAHWNEVRYDSAVANFGRARELWAMVDDPNSLGRVYNNLGAAHYQWGNYDLALTSFLRALEYRRQLGQEAGQALALTNVGRTYHDWGQSDRAREAHGEAIEISARSEVQALKGLIPICSHCKRIRHDEGYWESVESNITERSDAHFSHSICTECGPRVYGQDWAGDDEPEPEDEPEPSSLS